MQQLIYATAVPVSSGRHGKASIEGDNRYAFTRAVNSVPLMAVEFAEAADEYPIVFAAGGEDVVPLVVLGVRQNENLYLDAQDQWTARYIPAFVRRYPFVFSTSDDGNSFTLCVDEAYQGLNYLGRGQALFGADGQPSSYTQGVLQFLQEYRAQFLRTQALGRKLKELDLLEPMQAEFTQPGGAKASLTGFSAVSRARLKALPAQAKADLVDGDAMELLMLHLHSLRNFTRLKDRWVQAGVAAPAAAIPGPDTVQ